MTGSPLFARRALGRQLERLRAEAGLTQVAVANDPRRIVSLSKLKRLESGEGPYKYADITALCDLYGAEPQVKASMVNAAAKSDEGGWWEDYTSVIPNWFAAYVEFESVASDLRITGIGLIPGILQIPAYSREVFKADTRNSAKGSVERHLELRARRQQAAFGRKPGLRLTAVLDEGVLRRQVGGEQVMRHQREHLTRMSGEEGVKVLVIPAAAGAHPGMLAAYSWLSFEPPDEPDLIYAESINGAKYSAKPEQVAEIADAFARMEALSVPIKEMSL